MTEAQEYLVRDFDVIVEEEGKFRVKLVVQCRRPYDSKEWEVRTVRVQGTIPNSESMDIADLLCYRAEELYIKIEEDALSQCEAYDRDAPAQAALDAMKE